MSKAIAFHSCGPRPGDTHPEEWMMVGIFDDGSEQREAMADADKRDRLMCDVCQEYQMTNDELTPSGGEMLCRDCVSAELVEDADDA